MDAAAATASPGRSPIRRRAIDNPLINDIDAIGDPIGTGTQPALVRTARNLVSDVAAPFRDGS
jgi:hypothetical protein